VTRWVLSSLLLSPVIACGHSREDGPADTLEAYVEAVRNRDGDRAYGLLDEETRAELPRERFDELMEQNRAELIEQADRIREAGAEGVVATARVPLENGQSVDLVLEDGGWSIEGSYLGAPVLRTPRDAVLALRSALSRRSLRGLERVLARQPRAELEADIEALLEDTADELDLAIEIRGDRARVRTTSGRELVLVREAGEWRVLELR
jgi:hypothetical protein